MATNDRYACIPNELKELNQWVCYRLEDRNGNITKIPYTPDGANAKVNDPTTWRPFSDVVDATENSEAHFNGIMFVLTADDPYVFIDFDHVVSADDVIEEWAKAIINKMGSYTEYSQSRTGVHIIAKAEKPGPRCRVHTNPQFEIYEEGRMVVFTGSLYPNTPAEINDAQDAVDDIYSNIFGSPTEPVPMKAVVKNTRPMDLSDDQLIEKAMSASNGDKFSDLWNGNTGEYNGDHSTADIALCCMLAFWTQRDAVRMDQLFRNSGLMRDKWDENHGEKTYGMMTIDEAIANTTTVYQPEHTDNVVSDSSGRVYVTAPQLPKLVCDCLTALYTYTRPRYIDRELLALAENGVKLSPVDAPLLFSEAYQQLSDYERAFLQEQLRQQHIPMEIVNRLLALGTQKEVIRWFTMDELRVMPKPDIEELPILGVTGSKAFVRGRTHCLTGKPSCGKTELLAQSALFWNASPVIILTEDSWDVWYTRAQSYHDTGLPGNPLLRICSCLGEGHSFILDTIRGAEPGSIVIVDTLRAFAGVNDEASGSQWASAIDPWVKASKDAKGTLFCVHHNRKGNEASDPSESSSGSNSLMSRFEQRLQLKSAANGVLTLEGQAKNWSVKESSWRWKDNRIVEANRPAAKDSQTGLGDTLHKLLDQEEAQTVKQLITRLAEQGHDASDSTLRSALNRLNKAGRTKNMSTSGAAKWILVSDVTSISELPTAREIEVDTD